MPTVRVAAYNVHGFRAGPRTVAEALGEESPDVALLNEVGILGLRLQRCARLADGVDDRVGPFLAAERILERVVDLRRDPGRPGGAAEHLQRQGAGEHEHAGDPAVHGDVLGHPAAVGEPGGDEPVVEAGHGIQRPLHERRIADALG